MQQDCLGGETEQAHTRERTVDTHLHMTDPGDPGAPLEHFLVAK